MLRKYLSIHLRNVISIKKSTLRSFNSTTTTTTTSTNDTTNTTNVTLSEKSKVSINKIDDIFKYLIPSEYHYTSDVWNNSNKYPVLPDYELLRNGLYADTVDDFFKLINNIQLINKKEMEKALKKKDFKKAEEVVRTNDLNNPAAVLTLAMILKWQGKNEEAKILLNFTSSSDDALSKIYCWILLRELGHKAENQDEILGFVYEVATDTGNDIIAVYNDRSAYAIFSGGRSGYTQYFCTAPIYPSGDELRSNSENDAKVHGDLDISISNDINTTLNNVGKHVVAGAPVDVSPITTLYNPKANADTKFYFESRSTFNPDYNNMSKEKLIEIGVLNATFPCRLTFLTPGGKRLIESDSSELRNFKGGLSGVYLMAEYLRQSVSISRNVQINNGKCYMPSSTISTSEYALKKLGIDRHQTPENPLRIPQYIIENGKQKERERIAAYRAKCIKDGGYL